MTAQKQDKTILRPFDHDNDSMQCFNGLLTSEAMAKILKKANEHQSISGTILEVYEQAPSLNDAITMTTAYAEMIAKEKEEAEAEV